MGCCSFRGTVSSLFPLVFTDSFSYLFRTLPPLFSLLVHSSFFSLLSSVSCSVLFCSLLDSPSCSVVFSSLFSLQLRSVVFSFLSVTPFVFLTSCPFCYVLLSLLLSLCSVLFSPLFSALCSLLFVLLFPLFCPLFPSILYALVSSLCLSSLHLFTFS